MTTVIVRFQNESVGVKFQSFDESKFEPTETFGDETFGYYEGQKVAVTGLKNIRIMDLHEARKRYNSDELSFKALENIFFKKASDKEINMFWESPVFDRPAIVIGKTKAERDNDWSNLLKL